jgi:phage portal protein BeeE
MGRIQNAIKALFETKAAVPQHAMQASGGGYVQTFSSMSAWDAYTNRALNYWNGNTKINYAAEIGDLRLSVLIMAAIRWAGTNLGTGRIQVVDVGKDEKETPILDHPFTMLFKRPNPEATPRTLWKQFAQDWIIYGEDNFLISRDGSDRIQELWWEPWGTIRPKWDRNLFPEDETANDSIQYFEIYRNGRWIPWRKKDVFRVYDCFDPITRRGTNGVDALMRAIFTDQEREQYTALLLKNFGVSPKGIAPKFQNANMNALEIQSSLERKWSGDERAKAAVFNEPVDVLDFGTDFSADAMEKIAHINESRASAAIGISAQSLRFAVAQKSSTYNNVREFRREDYEQWVMPVHEDFLAAAESQILRDMDSNENHQLRFDYSKVPIVQRDRMEMVKETDMLVRARVIDQAEARERHAYGFDDEKYRDVFFPVPATALTLSPIGGTEPEQQDDEETKAAKVPKIKEAELDDSAEFWKEHGALTDDQRELIDAEPYVNGKVS